MTEVTSNDEESLPNLFYRENESDFESEVDDSENDSEEDEDLDEEINTMSSETKSINNKPSIKFISNTKPPTKRISLTIQRTLVYKYSCGHTKIMRYPFEKLCTTTKQIRIDSISNMKEYKETKFQCLMVKESRPESNSKVSQRKTNQDLITQTEDNATCSPKSRQSSRLPTYLSKVITPTISRYIAIDIDIVPFKCNNQIEINIHQMKRSRVNNHSSLETKQEKDPENQNKKVVRKKHIQNPNRIEMKRKQTKKCSKENTLKKLGFKQTITKRLTTKNKEENETVQT